MTDAFAVARDLLDTRDVVTYYAERPLRGGRMACPIHGGKHLSFAVNQRGWYCHSQCGEGGDAVRFVERLFGLKPLDALRRLNDDFGLRLPLDRHEPQPDQVAHQRRRERLRFERERHNFLKLAYFAVTDCSFIDESGDWREYATDDVVLPPSEAEFIWWELHQAHSDESKCAVVAKHKTAVTAAIEIFLRHKKETAVNNGQ